MMIVYIVWFVIVLFHYQIAFGCFCMSVFSFESSSVFILRSKTCSRQLSLHILLHFSSLNKYIP